MKGVIVMQDDERQKKMKEIREWGTFWLTLVTVIAIPIGLSVLHNIRLELEQEMSNQYLSKVSYGEDKTRYEQERRDQAQVIGSIQGKLESVLMQQVRVNENMSALKEQLNVTHR